ncbi:MAG: helix-turn-helix domain-containing protein [Acidobacteriota bacterium]|nr:helix-turn-helix domain-containing protein [Acidobacteriota bacterium]
MAADLEGAAFGEQLRRERERRGVALESICATTKVPVRHILALEAGALRELPGGVFRRGFVRSYLGALGLEEGSWMDQFEQSCQACGVREPGDTAWTAFAENVKNNRVIQRRRSRSLRLRVCLALLASGAAGWVVFRTSTHRNLVPHPLRAHGVKSWVDKLSSR